MESRNDVCKALGLKEKTLNAILYGRRLRRHYRIIRVPKLNGGHRELSVPPPELLAVQRRLLAHLKTMYHPKPCVHGFVRDRSIVSNATMHAHRRVVINFDLEGFFPSITFPRVLGVFRSVPFRFGDQAAETIAQICCRDDGVLPQGGATSPIVSNLVCRSLDNKLLRLARQTKCYYSRYADDLTFSTRAGFKSG